VKISNGVKVFYIANARMPTEKAHGIQLAKMCEAFLLKGVDLELVLPKRHASAPKLKDFYGLKVEIPVKKLPVLNLGFIVSSLSFMCAYFFYLWARRKESAVVYTIDMDNFSFLLMPFCGIPYFSEIHDAKPKSYAYRFFFRRIRGIITINNQIKTKLMETFGNKEIIVSPNGIDIEMFSQNISKTEARKKLNLPLDKRIALYVGKETWWKGMEILGEAKKLLPADTIYVVSDRPYPEIPMWMKAADICLVLGTKKHEYSYRYTSPMKLFEYMASKRPTIAADTLANREIVSEDEVTFYEPDNPSDLASKIKYALTNPPELELKADNAFKKVQQFSWSNRAKNILEFMKKI